MIPLLTPDLSGLATFLAVLLPPFLILLFFATLVTFVAFWFFRR